MLMNATFDTLRQFFIADEWFFIESGGKDQLILRMSHWGENGRFPCQAEYDNNLGIFSFHSYFPINVPEEKCLKMAQFITMANYGIRIGNFEMDFERGAVRFRTSGDFDGQEINDLLVSSHVYPNVWMMDRYLPGLFAVVNSDEDPKEIMKTMEE